MMLFLLILSLVLPYQARADSQSSLPEALTRLQYERRYPHFVEVAPCPCDLKWQKCDSLCCCDKDCSKAAKQNFTCKGQTQSTHLGKFGERNCSSVKVMDFIWHLVGDDHPITCLQDEQVPYLGLFHEDLPLLQTSAIVDAITIGNKGANFGKDVFTGGTTLNQYKIGSTISTIYDRSQGIFRHLKLPQTVMEGHCAWAPVQYLKDSSWTCPIHLDHNCRAFSRLDWRGYLTDSRPLVRSRASGPAVAPVKMNYYSSLSGHELVKLHGRRKAAATAESSSTDAISDLQFSPTESSDQLRLRKNVEKMKRAPGSIAFLNSSSSQCHNLVVEVEYHIHWSGSAINFLEVDILLANLSIKEDAFVTKRSINQRFSVTFHHDLKDSAVLNQQSENRTVNPGYKKGQKIRAFDDNFEDIAEGAFDTWNPDSSSLCRNSGLTRITFGQNHLSSCQLELNKSNFSDCDALRIFVKTAQERLFKASFLSRGRNPDFDDPDEFFQPIIYDTFNDQDAREDSLVTSCLVPSELRLEIMYTRASVISEQPIFRLSGVSVTSVYHRWQFACTSRPGQCPEVQNFELVSTVLQEELPLVWHHQNTSRFWVNQAKTFCDGDICWRDIGYPFTRLGYFYPYGLGDTVSYTVASGLILLNVAMLTLYIVH